MHPGTAEIEIETRIPGVKHEIAPGLLQGLLDEAARHSQTAVAAEYGAGVGAGLKTVGRRVGEADLFENSEGVFDDRGNALVGQRLVLAAAVARPNRPGRLGERRGASGAARLSAPHSSCHGSFPPMQIFQLSPSREFQSPC